MAPVVYLSGLSILALLFGTVAVRIVERHIAGSTVLKRNYALSSVLGVIGLLLLALAPNQVGRSAGVLLVGGITLPLTRVLATIQVNSCTVNRIRATVHSFHAQVEYLGKIICGIVIAAIAQDFGLPLALLSCGLLLLIAAAAILGISADNTKN